MKLTDMAKKLIGAILLILFLLILAGLILSLSGVLHIRPLPFVLGALLGGALNILKVLMLEHMVKSAAGKAEGQAARGVYMQALLRFVLTGVVLGLAILVPDRAFFWGAVAGIFILPIAAFSMKFVRHKDDDPASGTS